MNFDIGTQVLYVPLHAFGDRSHRDCEHGLVSSFNDRCVFVRYIRNGMLQSTAEATSRNQLVVDGDGFPSGIAMAEMQSQVKTLTEENLMLKNEIQDINERNGG